MFALYGELLDDVLVGSTVTELYHFDPDRLR